MGRWDRAPVLLVVIFALLQCAADDGAEILYRHTFAKPRCESNPIETVPIALINECFISWEGMPCSQTVDTETCGK
jgi:hypothetical protein